MPANGDFADRLVAASREQKRFMAVNSSVSFKTSPAIGASCGVGSALNQPVRALPRRHRIDRLGRRRCAEARSITRRDRTERSPSSADASSEAHRRACQERGLDCSCRTLPHEHAPAPWSSATRAGTPRSSERVNDAAHRGATVAAYRRQTFDRSPPVLRGMNAREHQEIRAARCHRLKSGQGRGPGTGSR